MLLQEIETDMLVAYDRMERLVNDGSRSGFSSIHMSSEHTNPLKSDGFVLKKVRVPSCFLSCYGYVDKPYSFLSEENIMYLHPDCFLVGLGREILRIGQVEDDVWVIPTASSRTVRVQNSNAFLKLHFPGMLGRLNRNLGYAQLMSGLTINSILMQSEQEKSLPSLFGCMPEPYGRLLTIGEREIGFVLREMPEFRKGDKLIPAFSLFSQDKENPHDSILLYQILDKQQNPEKFFVEGIALPLVDIFFLCAFSEGIIPEMHAQNVVFLFDEMWNVNKIILRDFESIDKDISIRLALGKDIGFKEYPYKSICDNDYDYLLRHSFMYDHKLCEYLIEPLVKHASIYLSTEVEKIQDEIKNYVQAQYGSRLNTFFPKDNCWYKYPNIEIDRTTSKRPFISMGRAIYR